MPEGSNLFFGSASENEVCRFHLFPSRGIEQRAANRHLSISPVQLRRFGFVLPHISTPNDLDHISPI
jgi:hypothetical protein